MTGDRPSETPPPDPRLRGRWEVRRESGLLPPFGIGKRIDEGGGVTTVFGIPVAPFTVVDGELRYRWLPVEDRVVRAGDGEWVGEGRLFGRRFCRFRLVR